MRIKDLPSELLERIRTGMVIPAHPLALDENRELDPKHQKALTRYYIDAGAGGIAVGVHSTQFEIRAANVGLFEPVLTLASETIDEYCEKVSREMIFKIAGVCGKTKQAQAEAEFALDVGYHACLLSLSAFADADIETLQEHCRTIAEIMPVVGFYLQPAVGGRVLAYEFWRQFVEIDNVIAIKIAPFNRYQTLDVVRATYRAGREKDIALYTGNDDNIVIDLLTEYKIQTSEGERSVRIVGGLLGQWAVWTKRAVELLTEIHQLYACNSAISSEMLTLAAQVTDANAAIFDAANSFAGCIAGVHEVLRRQGLMVGTWCLNPNERLSPGQKEEIDRLYKAYPHLNDDSFVEENLDSWLAD